MIGPLSEGTSGRRTRTEVIMPYHCESVVQKPLISGKSEVLRPNDPVCRTIATDDFGFDPELPHRLGGDLHTALHGGHGVRGPREWVCIV